MTKWTPKQTIIYDYYNQKVFENQERSRNSGQSNDASVPFGENDRRTKDVCIVP